VRNFGTLALPRAAALALKPIDLTTEPNDIWQRIRRGFAIRTDRHKIECFDHSDVFARGEH
jgi:hypothetical protein